MGRSYSINGYLNAIMRRSGRRTLLVEGASDKAAIHRMIAARDESERGLAIVDTPEIVKDEDLAGLGAKARICKICERVGETGSFAERISNLLGYLVDREWDGLLSDEEDLKWSPPKQTPPMFVTMGHSIENYYFDAACFSDYLRHAFAEFYTAGIQRAVLNAFPGAIAIAGAYSFVARRRGVMKRVEGLISFGHIALEIDGSNVSLGNSFVGALASRAVADCESFVDEVNDSLVLVWNSLGAEDYSRWLLHGHLGSEVLWSVMGAVALQQGVPSQVAEQITHGFQAERQRVCWGWLVAAARDRIPLDDAVGWLLKSPQVSVGEMPLA